ncbi:hypothetical protein LTS18_002946 [Coniosporium uncinatum]|uniref:Uncharacterized protein n=1 Tax=Coniosporium uncinatum TaxID=93489 RepID=A0ACC3DYU5_9PEZI|nr:hypothetical protein LTS18_002946 [Coniosporium uncinatum]
MIRLLALASPALVQHTSSGADTIIDTLAASDVFNPSSPPNNAMLAVRTLANLFHTSEGRLIVDGDFDKIQQLVEPLITSGAKHRNLIIAITTLYINYSVLFTSSEGDMNHALTLMQDVTALMGGVEDSEALYRSLVAAGTIMSLGADLRDAAREAFDFDKVLARAEKVSPEPRIKNVVKEIKDELGA